jgi:hypothetical protein
MACWNNWKHRFSKHKGNLVEVGKMNFIYNVSMLGYWIKMKHHASLMALKAVYCNSVSGP